MFSKYAWSLYIWKHSTSKVSPKKCSFLSEMSCAQTLTRFCLGFVTYENTAEGRGNKALQTKTTGKGIDDQDVREARCMQIRLHGFSRGKHATPNYITLKQIQIIDTLVAKFCKAHDATPQHDTFKTPRTKLLQTPATLETLGSTSAVSVASSWSLEGSMCQFMDYTVMEQPVARNLFQSLAAGIMLVEPQQSSSDISLCSHPVASKTSQSGITWPQNSKKDRLWLQNSKPKFDLKNEAIFGFA